MIINILIHNLRKTIRKIVMCYHFESTKFDRSALTHMLKKIKIQFGNF